MIGATCITPLPVAAAAATLLAQAGRAKEDAAPTAEYLTPLAIWGAVLVLMIVIGTLVVRRLRDSATQNRQHSGELLSNFQEMRQEGDISDAEFRNIKSVLGNQVRSEVKRGKKPH